MSVTLWRRTFTVARKFTGKAFSPKYLLVTNTLLSGVLSGSADGLVQVTNRHLFENGRQKQSCGLNLIRTSKMVFVGLGFGVLGHYWYLFLEKKVVGNTMKAVLKKTLIDQVFFSPVIIAFFFIMLGVIEQNSPQCVKEDLIQKGKQIYLVEWCIWPPAQMVNFRLLPPKFRVLYDSCLSFVFDIYYSHIKYEK